MAILSTQNGVLLAITSGRPAAHIVLSVTTVFASSTTTARGLGLALER